MKKTILITAAVFTAGFLLQSCNNGNNGSGKTETDKSMAQMEHADTMGMGKMNNEMMESMNSTMDKMKDMKMTGDFDIDFANMMMIHHQTAIDMSEVEIAKGTDTEIKAMAQNIITAQKAEIEQMQQFANNYKMPESKMKNDEMHNELAETMKSSMDKMMNMQMSGNTDKDFVMMMIPHHEAAVKMAKDEIEHGKQVELKNLAEKIINDQTREIKELEAWLASHK